MVAKGNIVAAKQEIEKALDDFVASGAVTKVYVFETEAQHLRAVIGSDGFSGVGVSERQKIVWSYLQEHVKRDLLTFLVAVHPMNIDEYDRNVREV